MDESISQIQSVVQALSPLLGKLVLTHVFNVVGHFGGLGDERSHPG